MPSIVKNDDAENCLREILEGEGYGLTPNRGYGETGVDIIAQKGNDEIHIEVIGHKSSGPARAKDFYEAFFRAVSRLDDGAQRCVIAMPHLAKRGLPDRARQYGVAWDRIGDAFPELQIWLVNVEARTYEKTVWHEWSPNKAMESYT